MIVFLIKILALILFKCSSKLWKHLKVGVSRKSAESLSTTIQKGVNVEVLRYQWSVELERKFYLLKRQIRFCKSAWLRPYHFLIKRYNAFENQNFSCVFHKCFIMPRLCQRRAITVIWWSYSPWRQTQSWIIRKQLRAIASWKLSILKIVHLISSLVADQSAPVV